jgi:hypothetical protein
VPGKAEPEHPAPAFTVSAATATGDSSAATPAASAQASSTSAPPAASGDITARVLAGAALLIAVAVGGLVLLRRDRMADTK